MFVDLGQRHLLLASPHTASEHKSQPNSSAMNRHNISPVDCVGDELGVRVRWPAVVANEPTVQQSCWSACSGSIHLLGLHAREPVDGGQALAQAVGHALQVGRERLARNQALNRTDQGRKEGNGATNQTRANACDARRPSPALPCVPARHRACVRACPCVGASEHVSARLRPR